MQSIIESNNQHIELFLKKYSSNNLPIEISFRDILPSLNKIDRCTHLIHSYPAKLLVQIPFFFLNNDILSKPNSLVLDPFCGSGTVLLESILSGRNAIGTDSNPLARLISQVKIENYENDILEEAFKEIIANFHKNNNVLLPEVMNMNFWFKQQTQKDLGKLLFEIESIESKKIKDFFLVCFSNCVKKVSLADPRISVPVRLNYEKYEINSPQWVSVKKTYESIININVLDKFTNIVRENINRVKNLKNVRNNNHAEVVSINSRNITTHIDSNEKYPNDSVDLIITSPPYAGAQKYIRSSRLNLGWAKLAKLEELKHLENSTIGRENYPTSQYKTLLNTGISSADKMLQNIFMISPERAHIAGNYIYEMKQALDESIRVLKNNGYIVLVVGNNQVCGLEFNTQEYLTEYLVSKGLSLSFKLIDDIRSFGLMTKRNKTASIITREWILVFKKI